MNGEDDCTEWLKLTDLLFYRGVVAVSMDMLQLDINQCEDDFYIPNAFKGTHKCDEKTSYVSIYSET